MKLKQGGLMPYHYYMLLLEALKGVELSVLIAAWIAHACSIPICRVFLIILYITDFIFLGKGIP